jgi:hypothetical protein
MDDNQQTRTRKRDRVNDSMNNLRERVAEKGETARETLQEHPGIAVAVAATVGAVVASVVPTSRREEEALRPVAQKARTMMDKAVATAKSTGLEHLTEKGLTSASISSGVAGLVSAVLKAGKTENTQQAQAPAVAEPDLPMADTQPA